MEKTFIVPLRREFQKAPIYARTKRAIKAVREYLIRHMRNEDVRLGKHINMYMWQNGNRNPPHKIEVVADVVKDKDYEYVIAELKGKSLEDLKPKVVEKKKEGLAGKLEGMVGDKKKTEKKKPGKVTEKQAKETEKKVEEKKEAAKVETKKEEVAKLEKKEKVSSAKVEEKEVKQEQKVERAEKGTAIKK